MSYKQIQYKMSYKQIWKNGEKKKKLPEIPLLALLSFDAKYSKLNIDIRQLFINKCPMKLHLFEQKTFVS